MRFAIIALLVSAGIAAAQSAGECDAQHIVDACRTGVQTELEKCEGNDWICLCNNYINLQTCYNNCPDLPEGSSVDNQVIQYCAAAEP